MAQTNLPGSTTPSDLIAQFGRLMHARDLDGLVSLYDDDAVFIPQPAVAHRGRAAIRTALGEMLMLMPTMDTRVIEVHESGEIALVMVEWSLQGTAPDGTAVTQRGTSADVMRRVGDGSWRILIDHP